MATYRLKRKTFSGEEGEKKGMGLGTKLALGAAAVGGGLLAAKHGAFGAKAQKWTGQQMMNVGMTKSGANTIAKGQMKDINKARAAKKLDLLTGDAAAAQEKKIADNLIKKNNYQQARANSSMDSKKYDSMMRDAYRAPKTTAVNTGSNPSQVTRVSGPLNIAGLA